LLQFIERITKKFGWNRRTHGSEFDLYPSYNGFSENLQSETTLEGKDAEIRKLINDFVESENELKRQLAAANAEVDSLNTQLEGNRIIIKDLNGDLEKIQQEANTAKKASEDATSELEATKLRFKELEVELQERSVQVTATNELESSKREFMATELQQLKTDREDLARRNEELLLQLATLQTSYDALSQDQPAPQPASRSEIDALTVEIEQLNRKNREIAEENEKLQQQLEQAPQTPVEASTDEAAAKENQSLKEQLQKIMHEVHDVSNRNQFLEQQCENFLILEQSNERLKLANEKLSRQLDETLVRVR
jgi:chromosome segregation ATPase